MSSFLQFKAFCEQQLPGRVEEVSVATARKETGINVLCDELWT